MHRLYHGIDFHWLKRTIMRKITFAMLGLSFPKDIHDSNFAGKEVWCSYAVRGRTFFNFLILAMPFALELLSLFTLLLQCC